MNPSEDIQEPDPSSCSGIYATVSAIVSPCLPNPGLCLLMKLDSGFPRNESEKILDSGCWGEMGILNDMNFCVDLCLCAFSLLEH